MAKKNIEPTKNNLLILKQRLKFAQNGLSLLKQKRDILINELIIISHNVKKIEDIFLDKLFIAYESLKKTIANSDDLNFDSLFNSLNIQSELKFEHRKIMGLNIPVIKYKYSSDFPFYGFYNLPFSIDDTILKFQSMLDDLSKYIEATYAVIKICNELKKTIKRVNALEKIVIPELENNIKYINFSLEEQDRSKYIVQKIVKNKILKKFIDT
ncbi:MAG TPA: V-type ATP synthase subunit D [bacterium]|nr:V-type ATP synthase subunit D [bacterium]HOL48437.1 V-type ATP synthase subunit D [bacterium]HPQ18679.1 V-type ATP synthase subunit D [bacterium]